jgi:hypothetical protein
MTAATAEALAKTLNALVREGWDEPAPEENAEVSPHVSAEDRSGSQVPSITRSLEQELEQMLQQQQ